ncbi:SRPBCC family protein [Pontibacter korlensis]|uniref:Cell division protein n=1 Tax=Pontibacter korlensis TaxID=400092 RepID=A0A0E3ZCQ9_9BACT|nr:SRPBCC family protein [Pontibacter korlensis]AKD02595.1 cell division protein [Pontibacter korlensis]
MPVISFETIVKAPIEVCFDLSRSIDLHSISTRQTGERAIAGVTSGLIELSETVTWRAKHLGIWQNLTSKITEYNRPYHFSDEMVRGAFKRFKHEHHFRQDGDYTVMLDIFDYTSPFGPLGKLADKLFLKEYMARFLHERDSVIKEFAESDRWQDIVNIARVVKGL